MDVRCAAFPHGVPPPVSWDPCVFFAAVRLLAPLARDDTFAIPGTIVWFFGVTFPTGSASGASLPTQPCCCCCCLCFPLRVWGKLRVYPVGGTAVGRDLAPNGSGLSPPPPSPPPLHHTLPPPRADRLRVYFRQSRDAVVTRLLDVVFLPDDTPNKHWMYFAKRTFMGRDLA